jgi:hypothetical protein
MPDIPLARQAEIQATVRHLPDMEWLRLKAKDWSLSEFDYAFARVPIDLRDSRSLWNEAKRQLETVRDERRQELTDRQRQETEEGRHREMIAHLVSKELPTIQVSDSQVMIGDHNVQINQVTFFKDIVDKIDASPAPNAEKEAAKGLLGKFLEHPVTAAVVGQIARAVFTPK